MNKEQIKLLRASGYDVLEEVNFIRDNTAFHPHTCITFNRTTNMFDLCVYGMQISSYDIEAYKEEINSKLELISKLNKLA